MGRTARANTGLQREIHPSQALGLQLAVLLGLVPGRPHECRLHCQVNRRLADLVISREGYVVEQQNRGLLEAAANAHATNLPSTASEIE
jgi:hypothetical protein